jgi:hypothetical protein
MISPRDKYHILPSPGQTTTKISPYTPCAINCDTHEITSSIVIVKQTIRADGPDLFSIQPWILPISYLLYFFF